MNPFGLIFFQNNPELNTCDIAIVSFDAPQVSRYTKGNCDDFIASVNRAFNARQEKQDRLALMND